MSGSFYAGRPAGIRLEIHYSWLFIVALLTASLALGWYPQAVPDRPVAIYWVAGLVASLLLFLCVLSHELGHAIVARARGQAVSGITLFIFGGVSNLEHEPRRARVELQIAVAGPLVSVAFGIVLTPAGIALASILPLAGTTLYYLGVENLLLALFNLIPGFPLDGGRVLRALLWSGTGSLRTATRWATWVGEGIAVLFVFAGLLAIFHGNILAGIWLVFVGWFLFSTSLAAGSRQLLDAALDGVRVGDVMNPAPVTVPIFISLSELVSDYLEPHHLNAAPVVAANQLLGLVSLSNVLRIPRKQWDDIPVGHVMAPLERVLAVSPDDALGEALALMAAAHMRHMPVLRGWQLAGMLSRDAITRYLQTRRGLTPDEAEQEIAHKIETLRRAS